MISHSLEDLPRIKVIITPTNVCIQTNQRQKLFTSCAKVTVFGEITNLRLTKHYEH